MTFRSLLDQVKENIDDILHHMGVPSVPFGVYPSKPGFGDVCTNAPFLLSKHLKKSPQVISKILFEEYNKNNHNKELILCAKPHVSGYLNFFANWHGLSRQILTGIIHEKFGSVNVGDDSSITIEHTSVNPNKPLHIGHIRNIVIGDTISRILKQANYTVHVLNYIDDSGLQVADILVGFTHLGFPEESPHGKKFDHYCGDDVYVKTVKQYETKPELYTIRKKTLQDLEDGTSQTAVLADRITRKVLAGQLETCWRLLVSYDCLNFESQIIRSGLWNRAFEKLKKMNLIELEHTGKNAGCWVIRGDHTKKKDSRMDNLLDGDTAHNENSIHAVYTKDTDNVNTVQDDKYNPDKVIVRSDGTATYMAKDIPYAAWKLGLVDDPFGYIRYNQKGQVDSKTLWQTTLDPSDSKMNFTGDRVITVIDSRQSGLQGMVTDLMGRFKSRPDAYVHLGYASVTLSSDTAKILQVDTGGKQAQMSGRKGLYVDADFVYDTLYKKVMDETKRRNVSQQSSQISSDEISDIAHDVTIGTIRYEMIKQDLDKIISFDLEKSLNLQGDTAPYLQYTGARASRILERSEHSLSAVNDVDYGLLTEKTEIALIRRMGLYETCVIDAANNLSPKVVARYCHDLAVDFNAFYESNKVLGVDNPRLENARLFLVYAFRIVLEKSLYMIGIPAPQRM